MKLGIELNPFLTPNFVIVRQKPGLRQHGFKKSRSVAIRDLDADTLAGLCDEFRRDVFRKAGKEDPEK